MICPDCKGDGVEYLGDDDDIGDACNLCDGTGVIGDGMTVAELRARYPSVTDVTNDGVADT